MVTDPLLFTLEDWLRNVTVVIWLRVTWVMVPIPHQKFLTTFRNKRGEGRIFVFFCLVDFCLFDSRPVLVSIFFSNINGVLMKLMKNCKLEGI